VIRTIDEIDVSKQRVLTRVDFNVPLNDAGAITDDTRIRESLPTIDSITSRGGIAILMSHLGRPKGQPTPKYSLRPVGEYLASMRRRGRVLFADDCVGTEAQTVVGLAQPGDVVLLENLRFHDAEEKNDDAFASSLASLGTVYCNDAFGTAHRAHASTAGIASHFDTVCAGLLMQKELKWLGDALREPQRPLVSVMGGSKISGKIDVISALLDSCNSILIGGGMMFTFFKAMGYEVGSSLVEEDKLELAKQLIATAKEKGVELLLPTDTIIAEAFSNDAQHRTCSVTEIPQGWMGLDIGPETSEAFANRIVESGTVVWNGPMGVFEMSNFESGTRRVAEAMVLATKNGTITIVGGGDSAAAMAQFGFQTSVTHVSTGGGASLEFLEGRTLPGVEALNR